MKTFLGLLLVIGLLAVGWANRERIQQHLANRGAVTETGEVPSLPEIPPLADLIPTTPQQVTPAATPHPAPEAQAQAKAIYPGLFVPNSALNQKFVALYKNAQASDPALLTSPEWPLQLADQAMVALGGAPMARTAATVTAATTTSATAPAKANRKVVIYTTSHCPYCTQAKQYFAEKKIPFKEVDIERSTSGKAEFKRLGGEGVPLIIVGDAKLKGFNASKLDNLLL
jgi:glutaredoxin